MFNPIYVTAFFGLLFIFLPINFGEIFSKSILNIFFISLAFFAFMFSREYGVYWFSPFSTAHDDIVSYIAILDNPRDIRGSDLMQPICLILQFLYGYIGFSGYNLLIFSFLSIFAVMYSISRISLNINLTIFVTIAIFWGFWDVFGHLYRVTLALPFLIVLMTQSILYDQLKLRWVMISSAIHLSYYFFFTRLIFRKNDLISLVLALIAPAI